MNLIVGLGNPGKKYQRARHNLGFRVIDSLGRIKNTILLKPKIFMNQSGQEVKSVIDKYKIKPENIMVIHDDIDLPLGKIRISFGRGSAGHRGVQSIINELGTKDFYRLRIGICPEEKPPKEKVNKFVMSNFKKGEEKIIKEILKRLKQVLSREPL